MPTTYRVRYAPMVPAQFQPGSVLTLDLQSPLEDVPALLPPAAYILSVEDLTAGQIVHWTRWPESFRPGGRNLATGAVAR